MSFFKKGDFPVKLEQILEGISFSIVKTNQNIIRENLRFLREYFTANEDGVFEPISMDIKIAENYVVKVPLVSLVLSRFMSVKTLDMDITLSVKEAEMIKTKLLDRELSICELGVAIKTVHAKGEERGQRASNEVDMTIRFEAGEVPEGIMRLLDECLLQTSHIKPDVEPAS